MTFAQDIEDRKRLNKTLNSNPFTVYTEPSNNNPPSNNDSGGGNGNYTGLNSNPFSVKKDVPVEVKDEGYRQRLLAYILSKGQGPRNITQAVIDEYNDKFNYKPSPVSSNTAKSVGVASPQQANQKALVNNTLEKVFNVPTLKTGLNYTATPQPSNNNEKVFNKPTLQSISTSLSQSNSQRMPIKNVIEKTFNVPTFKTWTSSITSPQSTGVGQAGYNSEALTSPQPTAPREVPDFSQPVDPFLKALGSTVVSMAAGAQDEIKDFAGLARFLEDSGIGKRLDPNYVFSEIAYKSLGGNNFKKYLDDKMGDAVPEWAKGDIDSPLDLQKAATKYYLKKIGIDLDAIGDYFEHPENYRGSFSNLYEQDIMKDATPIEKMIYGSIKGSTKEGIDLGLAAWTGGATKGVKALKYLPEVIDGAKKFGGYYNDNHDLGKAAINTIAEYALEKFGGKYLEDLPQVSGAKEVIKETLKQIINQDQNDKEPQVNENDILPAFPVGFIKKAAENYMKRRGSRRR